MNKVLLASICTAMVLGSSVKAATTVGVATDGNTIPFSSPLRQGVSIYQQIYAGSAFAGMASINRISFDYFLGDELATADLDIFFYLTPLAVGELTDTAANNRGTLLSNFGSFSISGAAPSVLSFQGPAFDYDPLMGNLLMQINYTDVTRDGFSFYARDARDSVVTQRYIGGDTGRVSGSGLVTTFDFVNGGVPEPATWAFMIIGFGAVGSTLRQQRKANVKPSFA